MAAQARNTRILPVVAFFFAALSMTACGTSLNSFKSPQSNSPSAPSSSIAAVSASCTPAAVGAGTTSQCTATVRGTGDYSSAVSWSASAGAISTSGLFTAPASGGNVTVTASSTQDPAKSGAALLKIQPPASAPVSSSSAISSVSVACSPASLATGAKSQCKATVQGTGNYSSAVNWSASAGAISTSGLFTAPASGGNVTITASSTQDPSKSDAASLKVRAPASGPTTPSSTIRSVSVVCSPVSIATNGNSQCTAKVQGTGSYSSAVSWSASTGIITPSGLFTAPASAGNVTVTASSTQDPSKSGTTLLKVQAPVKVVAPTVSSVSVVCSPASLTTGATSQCTAKVQGTGSYNSAVTWKASTGAISSAGLFTAPSSAATATITATSVQDTSKFGNVSIKVTAPASTVSSVSVVCSPASLATNAKSQCAAKVQGTGSYNSAVTWKASTGVISSAGLFTAPAAAATATITAISVQDTSKSGTATIKVTAAAPAPSSKHVVMVMEENQSYSTIVGNGNWPSLNSLIRNGSLATNYYGNVHPSIGNYFMLTTGQVLTTDDSSTKVWNVDNIARRMLSAGVSFRIYAEAIPGPGYLGGNTGPYLIRHQPFAMLSDLADNQTLANQHIFPFTQFATDIANGNLPAYSFIVPDVNDDAHDGTPQQADSWLQTKVVSPLSNDSAFQPGGGGVLIVDFDEAFDSDTTHGGGHIPAVFWGPAVKTGYTQASSTVYQHQSMLRTIMQYLGLSNPPGAAASAPSMTEFFK